MAEKDYVIGIDCSTTAPKAVVWDSRGNAVAEGRATFDLSNPLGISITVNKVPGVGAARCHHVFSAEREEVQRRSGPGDGPAGDRSGARQDGRGRLAGVRVRRRQLRAQGGKDGGGGSLLPLGRRDLLGNTCA